LTHVLSLSPSISLSKIKRLQEANLQDYNFDFMCNL